MKLRSRIAPIAGLLIVLASVVTVSAEDTRWELWMKDSAVAGPYLVLASFDSRPECIEGIKRKHLEFGPPSQTLRDVETGSAVWFDSPGSRRFVLLQCVRDTFTRKSAEPTK